MQIHLSKPGGQREGPFTLEQINVDLAAQKYRDTDYWAWHEGLTEWVPLHSVVGIRSSTSTKAPAPPQVAPKPTPGPAPEITAPPAQNASAPEPETPPSLHEQLSSGLPIEALEQIFILTTGESKAGSRSPVTAGLLQAVVGAPLEAIRQSVPRDIVTQCDFLQKVRGGGSLPEAAWRALAVLKPDLVKRARGGSHRVCIRTYPIENGDVLALVLFYNKERL